MILYKVVSDQTSFSTNLNITGRTTIGIDYYHFNDKSIWSFSKIQLRKNDANLGDIIELDVGVGTSKSFLSMQEGYDINLRSQIGNIYIQKR